MSDPTSSLRWTLSGLLEHLRFVNTNMPDHAYAWVLGAGASLSSGIPLAGELVRRWLNELHRRLDSEGRPLAEWATADNLGIPKFDYKSAASSYSRVYERRFGDNPDEGFAYLEALMTNKDPSPGYSILAQVLEKTTHKVVISTNFDNLVADALSIYTETFPLVIGHESLANFVRVVSRRPVICKIHRDLLLGPKNDHRSLRRLHESWAAALRALFSQHTPLFIGYGGNDDSLMDLLESLDPGDIKGQLIWCYHERFEPSERVVDLVRQHAGALVPVPDFDLLMVLIGDQMGIEPIDDAIETRAAKRARQYRDRLIKLDSTTYPEVRRVLRGAFERAGGTLAWLEKVRTEVSTDRRRQIFEHALEEYPNDLSLQLKYAQFIKNHHLDDLRCREMLTTLQSHDQELEYLPSFNLVVMDIWGDRLEDARKTLAEVPESPATHFVRGLIEETKGDTASAEREYRLAHEHITEAVYHLSGLLVRQGRIEECASLLEVLRSKEPAAMDTNTMVLFEWFGRKDVETAHKLLVDVVTSPSTENLGLVIIACLELIKGDVASCARRLEALKSRPKESLAEEFQAAFLDLVYNLLTGNSRESSIQELRALFGRSHRKYALHFPILTNLAESVNSKIPKPHRKFIVALAEAYYNPESRNTLNVYEQWRTANDPD